MSELDVRDPALGHEPSDEPHPHAAPLGHTFDVEQPIVLEGHRVSM